MGVAARRCTPLSRADLREVDDWQARAAGHHLQPPGGHPLAQHRVCGADLTRGGWGGGEHAEGTLTGRCGRGRSTFEWDDNGIQRRRASASRQGCHGAAPRSPPCVAPVRGPLACGNSASSSAAVMSLMEGAELAAMMTSVPRRSSSRANGSMPAGCGRRVHTGAGCKVAAGDSLLAHARRPLLHACTRQHRPPQVPAHLAGRLPRCCQRTRLPACRCGCRRDEGGAGADSGGSSAAVEAGGTRRDVSSG